MVNFHKLSNSITYNGEYENLILVDNMNGLNIQKVGDNVLRVSPDGGVIVQNIGGIVQKEVELNVENDGCFVENGLKSGGS